MTTGNPVWRLIPYAEETAAFNMAADEAILDAVAAGESPPTLRFYGWSESAMSIGSAEPRTDVDADALDSLGVTLVRRGSGGTAVLHDGQVAYSTTIKIDDRPSLYDVVESYRVFGQPLLAAALALGVDGYLASPDLVRSAPKPTGPESAVCFAWLAPYELLLGGRKLAGNSQHRRRGAILHHTAVQLSLDADKLAKLIRVGDAREREIVDRYVQNRIGSFRDALGHSIDAERFCERVAVEFARGLSVHLKVGCLSAAESAKANALILERFGNPGWSGRR